MKHAANISLGLGIVIPFLSVAAVILLYGAVQSAIQIVIGLSLLLSLAGLVLGIYSAFREKDSRVIGVLGSILNFLYLSGFAGFIILKMSS